MEWSSLHGDEEISERLRELVMWYVKFRRELCNISTGPLHCQCRSDGKDHPIRSHALSSSSGAPFWKTDSHIHAGGSPMDRYILPTWKQFHLHASVGGDNDNGEGEWQMPSNSSLIHWQVKLVKLKADSWPRLPPSGFWSRHRVTIDDSRKSFDSWNRHMCPSVWCLMYL